MDWKALKCSYCKGSASKTDSLAICPKCRAFHHYECFNENRGCAVFGCNSTQIIVHIRGLGELLAGTYVDGKRIRWRWLRKTG